ncbi:MAG: hypothetical protein AAFX92_00370 [Pseudomonadota bacterium]
MLAPLFDPGLLAGDAGVGSGASNETDIVKMFGQTVSYVDGEDITQQIVNRPVIEADDVWVS